jgi:hypothetical protein
MANIDDYNASIDAIRAIADEKAPEPTMPVDVFLQEAENLYQWSLMDLVVLATIGITSEMLNALPLRAGACREAQSRWFKDRNSQLEAQRLWGEQSPLAYALRDELLHAFRYAFRNETALLARVSEIAEGNTHADMIQDLNDLSVLGKNNPAPLQAIGFDLGKLDVAAATSDAIANLLAMANGDRSSQSETKKIRDKAFAYLKESVDQIREAGKYLFWKNENRYKGYVSKYWADVNRDKTTKPTVTQVD